MSQLTNSSENTKSHRKLRLRADDTLSGRALSLDREKLEFWLMFRPEDLRETLELFGVDGGREVLPTAVSITPFHRFSGYSGYQYRVGDDCHAEIGFSPLQYGGFAVHKLFVDSVGKKEIWEIYSAEGKLLSADGALFLSLLYTDLIDMRPDAPVLSHLYNYLAHEYAQAQFGQANTTQIALIEGFVRAAGALPLHRDPAVTAIWPRLIQAESDLNLNWEERQKVIEALLAERQKIVATKARAHGRKAWLSTPILKVGDYVNRARRVAMRPVSILRGFAYKYTIGQIIWFVQTVRGNIGYSMALAIYGPFTFYFITQPLNPHAMWAVGHVRTAYLDTTEGLKTLVGAGSAPVINSQLQTQGAQSQSQGAAAPAISTPATVIPATGDKHLGLPMSIDFPEVDQQSWSDRMSNFKNMQIGYEQNMQFAARMGRLEQMETQFNFPLIADNAWDETERYIDQLAGVHATSPELQKYLQNETLGARRIQLYVWDRLLRFVLDHPFVVMDQSKEQTYRDYYSGRAFTLLKDMTERLAQLHPDFKRPAEFKRIDTLANAFQKSHVEAEGILNRLRKNSKIFDQKDRFDGQELRTYMKREWETLYLLQNKAQEASNFGLMSYTWSVRNTLWLMQSLYSAKRRELGLLFPASGHPLKAEEVAKARTELKRSIEPMYESIFHMLNLEFVSLRPELAERLTQDVEYRQRHAVIATVEQFIKDRDAVVQAVLK